MFIIKLLENIYKFISQIWIIVCGGYITWNYDLDDHGRRTFLKKTVRYHPWNNGYTKRYYEIIPEDEDFFDYYSYYSDENLSTRITHISNLNKNNMNKLQLLQNSVCEKFRDPVILKRYNTYYVAIHGEHWEIPRNLYFKGDRFREISNPKIPHRLEHSWGKIEHVNKWILLTLSIFCFLSF